MTATKPTSQDDLKRIKFLDNREYQAKFLLDPDIELPEDFKHLDKNLAITNLKHNPKLHIDEVNEARSILRGLHALNNLKHYHEEEELVIIGFKDISEDGRIIRFPVYEKRKVKVSNFPKTFHCIRAEFIGLTNCTAARNGHRMRAANTNRLEKTETIQDKTKSKSRWSSGKKDY